MWRSASALPPCLDCQRSEVQLPQFCSARTSKGLKLRFRTFALPWLPIYEVPLSKFLFCQGFERSQVPLPHLFYQDLQRYEGPLPHFTSAGTSKDVKFRFRTFAVPRLSKIWNSASPLTLCFICQQFDVPLLPWLPKLRFRSTIIPQDVTLRFRTSACLDCQRCAVLLPQFCCMFLCHEGLAL